jgi:hypothetical protein
MSGAGLVELARRLVACSDELESLRDQITGGRQWRGGRRGAPYPAARQATGGKQHPNAAIAAEAEAQIHHARHADDRDRKGNGGEGKHGDAAVAADANERPDRARRGKRLDRVRLTPEEVADLLAPSAPHTPNGRACPWRPRFHRRAIVLHERLTPPPSVHTEPLSSTSMISCSSLANCPGNLLRNTSARLR